MIPEVRSRLAESDLKVTGDYWEKHIRIGIDSLKQLIKNALTVRHLEILTRP